MRADGKQGQSHVMEGTGEKMVFPGGRISRTVERSNKTGTRVFAGLWLRGESERLVGVERQEDEGPCPRSMAVREQPRD